MTPENIAAIKECFADDLIVCASGNEYEVALLPCLICPIRAYWETHDWEGKKDIFRCTDVVVKQKKEFQKWMAEQW